MDGSKAKGYRFQADWFSHVAPSWQLLFGQIGWNSSTPKTIIEIGCFEGKATVWMLNNLIGAAGSEVHCIDRFAASPGTLQWDFDQVRDAFTHNVGLTGKGSMVTLHESESFPRLVALYTQGLRADFIYVDGSHRARDVLADLVMAFEIAKPGGLIICDDYLWVRESDIEVDILNTPKIAVDAFVNIYRREIEICSRVPLYQFAFRRK